MATSAGTARSIVLGRAAEHRTFALPKWTVPVAVMLAVLARVPFLGRAPSPDEAGYLLVGSQWHGAGTSLYSNYWVDRPPLLVAMFQAAAGLGGIPALRVIGCTAVVLVVLGCAHAAELVGGRQAGRWASVVASALCVSPLLGGYAVNGEMLAAPFVVGGIVAVLLALQADTVGADVRWCIVAGGLGMCALMVKQNFADVFVFGAVALVVSAVRSDISLRRCVRLSGAALSGSAGALVAISLWTMAHGTSMQGVFAAMYPFRVQARDVLAMGGGHAAARLNSLLAVAFLSGVAILMGLVIIDGLRRHRRSVAEWGLMVLLVLGTASVLLGGNYWHHYLIGLIVPISIASGLLANAHRPLFRSVVVYAVVVASVAWAGHLATPHGSAGETVGKAIASAARPGDTIVNLYGHSDIVQAAGLSSPYEHLWSLPIKTLDPNLAELNRVLTGPDAPTWLVTGPTVRSWGLATTETAAIIARDYLEESTICGRRIYLRHGIDRPAPEPSTDCHGTSVAAGRTTGHVDVSF